MDILTQIKTGSTGFNSVRVKTDSVPVGLQVHCNIERQQKLYSSGGLLFVNNEQQYVLQNSTEPGDCGRKYRRDNCVFGYHIRTHGKNQCNELLPYAQLLPIRASLNL